MIRFPRHARLALIGRRSTVTIPDNQEGGIATASSTIGQKYQRAQMKHNRFSNLLMLSIVLAPVAAFMWYRMSKYSDIWRSYSDPYALPHGFDPNRDAPPSTRAVEPRRPMMTSVAPGGFGVLPTKEDARGQR
jgi:hypothetical protein